MKIINDYDQVIFHIGENAKENDNLFEIMSEYPEAYWFHLDGMPSTHVYMILEDMGTKLSKKEKLKLLKIGALLVRKYSKKIKGIAEICYLQRKYLKKDPKSKPGQLTLIREPGILKI